MATVAPSNTLTFMVRIDATATLSPGATAKAIRRALKHACAVDVAGAECLDHRIDRITVRPVDDTIAGLRSAAETVADDAGARKDR